MMLNIHVIFATLMIVSTIMTGFQMLCGNVESVMATLFTNFNVLTIELILCSIVYHVIVSKVINHE